MIPCLESGTVRVAAPRTERPYDALDLELTINTTRMINRIQTPNM